MSTIKLENRPNAEGLRELTTTEFVERYGNEVKENKDLVVGIVLIILSLIFILL